MPLHLRSTNFGHLVYFQDQHLSGCCEEDVSLSRTLWPANRVAICVAPAQKGPLPPSWTLPQSTKHFATFATDNAFPYNAMLQIPIRKLCCADFWSSGMPPRTAAQLFKSPNSSDVSAPLPWWHRMPFCSNLIFSMREKEKGRQRHTHTQDGLVGR